MTFVRYMMAHFFVFEMDGNGLGITTVYHLNRKTISIHLNDIDRHNCDVYKIGSIQVNSIQFKSKCLMVTCIYI